MNENMKSIDVIMCTYNSRRRGLLSFVLESIKNYVPVNRLIVIDKHSNDGTVELVKQYFQNNSFIVRTNVNIAYARYMGIKLVETEWFAFIDDDAIILPSCGKLSQNILAPKLAQ
jgi:glycosyltransferase involved in cell wall biosynthesis